MTSQPSHPIPARPSRDEPESHAPLPHTRLRRAQPRRCRPHRPPFRLGPPQARPRQPPVRGPAGPLRADAMRDRFEPCGDLRGAGRGAQRNGAHHHRRVRGARRRDRQPGAADRRGRGLDPRDRRAGRSRAAAAAGEQRGGLWRGGAAALPLPRSAPRQDAAQYRAALRHHRLDSPAHDRAGLPRVPDADPDGGEPRGREGLPGAVAPASGQVLCPAAGAAAVQAVADDRGLRPLFPDRALLPRRGRARRPLAGRVLPARLRDGVRDAGGRVRRHRAGSGRRVRRIRRRPRGHATALPAHRLRRGHAEIRFRQAGPPQSHRDRRGDRDIPGLRLLDLRARHREGRRGARHSGARRGGAAAQLFRPDAGLGA